MTISFYEVEYVRGALIMAEAELLAATSDISIMLAKMKVAAAEIALQDAQYSLAIMMDLAV